MQALLDKFKARPDIKVAGVVSNNSDAPALQRARRADVPFADFPRWRYSSRVERDEAIASWIEARGAGLVVLAGYLEILSPEFVNRFPSKIINIHPSLLPAFPGLHSIERAFEARVKKSGVTVHIVDEGVDTGPEIEQRSVKLRRRERLAEFEKRIHAVEHELLPNVVERIAKGELRLDAIPASKRRHVAVWNRLKYPSFPSLKRPEGFGPFKVNPRPLRVHRKGPSGNSSSAKNAIPTR